MELDRTAARSRAETLLALHRPGNPLVLVNVWDAASARMVASAGAAALATSSGAMAWCAGHLDGRGETIAGLHDSVARICAVAGALPVSVDVEAGFGTSPAQVAAAVRRVMEAGAVGINLEDRVLPAPGTGTGGGSGSGDPLFELAAQQVRIRAARAASDALGVPLVLNARTDVYLEQVGAAEDRFRLATQRAAAYRAAGADCVFVPGVRDAETIGRLVEAIDGPLNVLAVPGTPSVAELGALGVARVSLGSWPFRAVLGTLQRVTQGVLGSGTYNLLDGAISYPSAQTLMAPGPPPPAAD